MRVFRLLRLGIPVRDLGYDEGLPAHLGEWLLAIDATVNRVANERRS